MITSMYAKLILITVLAARHAPLRLGLSLNGLADKMIAASRHLPPMPRKLARPGAPSIGAVKCKECEQTFAVIALEGAELPDDPLVKALVECPDESCIGLAEFA